MMNIRHSSRPLRSFGRGHEDRSEFFCLLKELTQPRAWNNSSFHQQFHPIYALFQLLQPALNLTDKLGSRPCPRRLAILGANRSTTAEQLSTDDLGLRQLGERGVQTDNPQRE